MSIERTNPITGTEAQRRWLQANAATIEAAEEGASVGAQELHTSVDGAGLKRVFRCHENIGRTYHLGTVANEAAMLALDSPLTSHACLPGDTCFRTDTQQIMRCVSNYGVSVGDWEVVSSSSSADPAGTAATAVSTHNTATDSHADMRTLINGKQPSLTISDVGTALLNLSTPASAKIPRINADGSATLINVPSGGGGGGGARGLYSGLMSSDAPTQATTGLSTWYNQGSCTLSEHAGGLTILNPTLGSSDNIGGLYLVAPAAPWVLTTLVSISCRPGNYPAARLGFLDTGTGRTSSFGLCANGTLYVANFSAPSSWAGDLATVGVAGTRVLWLRLSDDGTSLHFSYSWDGVNFVELYSVSRSSAYAGYTHVFFGASSGYITASATLHSWSVS